MSLATMAALYQATALSSTYNNQMLNAWQGMTNLAGGPAMAVAQNYTPQNVAALAQMDKAFALQSAQASVMFAANQLIQQSAQGRLQKEFQARQEAIKNGSLFG